MVRGWHSSRAEPAASAQNVTVNAIAPGYINTGMFEAVARGSGEEHPCLYPHEPSLASLCIGLGMGVAMGIER